MSEMSESDKCYKNISNVEDHNEEAKSIPKEIADTFQIIANQFSKSNQKTFESIEKRKESIKDLKYDIFETGLNLALNSKNYLNIEEAEKYRKLDIKLSDKYNLIITYAYHVSYIDNVIIAIFDSNGEELIKSDMIIATMTGDNVREQNILLKTWKLHLKHYYEKEYFLQEREVQNRYLECKKLLEELEYLDA